MCSPEGLVDLGGTRVSDHLNSGPPSGGGDKVSNKVTLCSRWGWRWGRVAMAALKGFLGWCRGLRD